MYDPKATAVMRPRDANAFRSVALIQKVYIIVRQTNAQSIQWIGNADYIAKPIDCKPKTADFDADIDSHHVETAGLVVNPELQGLDHVFKSPGKAAKARQAWQKFFHDLRERGAPLGLCQPRNGREVRTWPGAHPGWAVQMCRTSRHYGCLLHSTYPQGLNGKYVHGDYDLFGIAPAGEPTLIRRRNEELAGQKHSRGPNTQSVQFAVNALSGLALVKHGEQELFSGFDEEALDVFRPDGSTRTLSTAAEAILFYRTELEGRQVFSGDGRPAGGLWLRPRSEGDTLAQAIAEMVGALKRP
ncbi:MAG: hypothetical protein U1E21_17770 [Reyranellaceae bacterium]